MELRAALDRYARFYETMSRADLETLDRLVTEDVRFKDPFNDVTGVDAMARCLAMAYDHGTPKFEVLDRAASERAGYLLWRYTSTPKGASVPAWIVEGMSEVRFAPDGRAVEHIDHWDSGEQFYLRLPIIGWLVGKVRARLKVGA
jgi:steroid delta-isomerase